MYKIAEHTSYRETGNFSKLILDYLDQAEELRPYFSHTPDMEGFRAAIEERKNFNTDRGALVKVLTQQYAAVDTSDRVKKNIELLASNNTFTICTAHQPNIFTGHLYFIYKIVHVIKLADKLNRELPSNSFVPVFYMGTEDADLEELGHIYIDGKKYEWDTKQTGAVGRMIIDDGLIRIIDDISGQLIIHPFGADLISALKKYFSKGSTLQDATFKLVDHLFKEYGLIVLLPDNDILKRSMISIFRDDILNRIPSEIVDASAEKLSINYKVQANPRDINLFYLKDGIRNRIVLQKNIYRVHETAITFTADELLTELNDHPQRFSPNVILRGLYQETILPNLSFVGGGGELSYWLELKDLFGHYHVPFPVLVLRNSFMLINKKVSHQIKNLDLSINDIFKSESTLLKDLVHQHSSNNLQLNNERQRVAELYNSARSAVKEIDVTLQQHVQALEVRTIRNIDTLEKKMIKAETKKFQVQQGQIHKLKEALFPMGQLQERVENFMPYYARYGNDFIRAIYDNSLGLEQQFTVLEEV